MKNSSLGLGRYGTYPRPKATDLHLINRYCLYAHPGVTDLDLITNFWKTNEQLDQAILNPVAGQKIEMGVMSELDYTIGLSGYKRIIRLGIIKDVKKLRSH